MGASKFASATKKKKAARIKYQFPKFWSFSRWEVANKCWARYEFQHLQKLPQPPSIHLTRGIKVHTDGEEYLDGTKARLPASYKEFGDEMRAIKKLGACAEGSYAFTKSWSPCSPTDWANAWLRVKIDGEVIDDAKTELTQIDFKTGKPWPITAQQAELYAVTGFLRYPNVDEIDVEFWYLDSGETVPYTFARSEYTTLKKKWAARGREIVAKRQFPPTTNAYNCKYCPFKSSEKLGNGQPGPCEAWRKAK